MLVDVTEPCCGHGSEVVVNLHSNLKCMHSTRYSMELHCPGAASTALPGGESVLYVLHYIIQCIAHCIAMLQLLKVGKVTTCYTTITIVMLQLLKLLHYITHCHVTVVSLHYPLPCYSCYSCYTTLPIAMLHHIALGRECLPGSN